MYKEGAYVLRNGRGALDPQNDDDGDAQVLDVLPVQDGIVELDLPETGRYPMVNHIMVDAKHGATGIVNVTE